MQKNKSHNKNIYSKDDKNFDNISWKATEMFNGNSQKRIKFKI